MRLKRYGIHLGSLTLYLTGLSVLSGRLLFPGSLSSSDSICSVWEVTWLSQSGHWRNILLRRNHKN